MGFFFFFSILHLTHVTTGLVLVNLSHWITFGYVLHISGEHLLWLTYCFDEGLELSSCTLSLVKTSVTDLGLTKNYFSLSTGQLEDWLFNTRRQGPLLSVDCQYVRPVLQWSENSGFFCLHWDYFSGLIKFWGRSQCSFGSRKGLLNSWRWILEDANSILTYWLSLHKIDLT